jgi:hypothetical protein
MKPRGQSKAERLTLRVEQLKTLILSRYPEAKFRLRPAGEKDTWDLLTYFSENDGVEFFDLTNELASEITSNEPFAIWLIPQPFSRYNEGNITSQAA